MSEDPMLQILRSIVRRLDDIDTRVAAVDARTLAGGASGGAS